MINDIKEIRKNREREQMNTPSQQQENITSSSKAQILNKLDQEIIQNYKFKISQIEAENSKLKEDLLAMQRNFEALCLKGKGDSEFIKKLEEEINYLKSKSLNHEKDYSKNEKEKGEIMKNYHDKIDHLNKIIKNLEEKINNSSNNNIKFLEKESAFKNSIAKLEERIKNYEIENKRFREEIKRAKEEKLIIEKELAEKKSFFCGIEDRIKSEQQSLLESNQKLTKENSLILKLLEETKSKLEESKTNLEAIKNKMEETNKNAEEVKRKLEDFKSLNNEKDNFINSLKEQLNSVMSKLNDLENRNQSFVGDNRQINKAMEVLKEKNLTLQNENSELLQKIKEKEFKWLEISKKYDDLLIKNSDFLAENSKLKTEIETLKSEINELIINDKKNLVDELTAQNHKLTTTNSILNSEVDLLKKENKNLKNELDAKGSQVNLEKMNEEKTRIMLFKVLKENVLNIENTNKKLMENNFDPIERKVILMQNKIRNLTDFIYEKINDLKSSTSKSSHNLTQEIKQREDLLNEQISKLRIENKELIQKNNELKSKNEELDNFNKRFKNELDTYKLLLQEEGQKQKVIKEKFERKKSKLKALRAEGGKHDKIKEESEKKVKDLENKITELEKKLEDSKNNNELKTCLNQIMSSNFKLALSLDSLYYMSLCRGCSEERNPQFIRSCGHTTCEECLKTKRECIECKEVNTLTMKIENNAFSNVVSKILFINQVKNDINSIIDFIKLKLS